MTLIDSHCHFDFGAFDDNREQCWRECRQAGVEQLVIPGVNPAELDVPFGCAESLPGIFAAVGLHPWWVAAWSEQQTPQQLVTALEKYLQHPKCVAVGECGLDGYLDIAIEQQLPWFEQQLKLACDAKLPVIIHVLKAHNRVIELLKKYRLPKGGVIHAFTGSAELGRRYWELGFYLGIGGTITYERARKTRDAVTQLPLQSLLLETDAPDMPLWGHQGQSNSPLYLPEIANCLAQLRGQSVEDIAAQTTANSQQLFGI
ncbi:TatD family hydrolase [Porticoccus sp. W117]|uniref:TatD family hydrolase n=1 Tax=Porticoccus sp. W117 TaxID=3054777 RepID=UPI00259616D1|nr:TatD family hydrolase [Porticoccus sp. W117]MDM3871461.1 TatD family hydrolase [Porticoccus sp. W117]